MATPFTHIPVLGAEVLEWLAPPPEGLVVDATLGGGGHAAAILACTAPRGRLIGLDRDPEALVAAAKRLAEYGERAEIVHAGFDRLAEVLAERGIERVDGVLFDLGVSSHQLDRPERGFRFTGSGAATVPLDMRMDPGEGPSAADLLAREPVEDLARIFRVYGELRGAGRLARAVVARREQGEPLRSAADLCEVVARSGIGRGRRHDPATLVFQALRIAVNDELERLERGLEAAIEALEPGRRIVVLAYHSLEDRIVKHRFREAARSCTCPPAQPVCNCATRARLKVLTRRPIGPGPDELRANPRARSAHLRAAERLPRAA